MLDENRWSNLDQLNQRREAERILSDLPAGAALLSVEPHSYAGRQRTVATYDIAGQHFVLVPATEAKLGHDASRSYEPTAEEAKLWQRIVGEAGLNPSLPEYLESIMTRPRTVEIPSLLVELTPQEPGWFELEADDPFTRDLIEDYLPADEDIRQKRVVTGSGTFRLRRTDDGTVIVKVFEPRTHADLAAELAAQQFRFPDPDEWEYLCGAGAQTIFRWGDHAPLDCLPTDISADEAAWKQRWVISGGKLPYPPDGFPSTWDLHRKPNAFRLFIATDPYQRELTTDAKTTRGGDGGTAICGGAEGLHGWLALATAYFDEQSCLRDPQATILAGYTVARRVLPLR